MAGVSTYLNFPGNTEQAFEFYRSVFGTQYAGAGLQRMSKVPPAPGQPPMPAEARQLVLHVSLPILGGHVLHGTDAHESMGFKLIQGNNVHINLHPDTRAEADALFSKLSAGGKIDMPLTEMFWGDYFGSFTDKFGMKWMVNTSSKT
jgi:PhnB protein